MVESRSTRRLSIWNKVAECEQALEKIYVVNQKIEKLTTLERLLALKQKNT